MPTRRHIVASLPAAAAIPAATIASAAPLPVVAFPMAILVRAMSARTMAAIALEIDVEGTPHYEAAQAESDRQEAAFSAMKYDVWSRPAADWNDIVVRAEIVRRHLDPGRDGRLVIDLDDCCDDRERALIDLALSVLRVAGREG